MRKLVVSCWWCRLYQELGISDCNFNTIVFLLVSISYYFIDYKSDP